MEAAGKELGAAEGGARATGAAGRVAEATEVVNRAEVAAGAAETAEGAEKMEGSAAEAAETTKEASRTKWGAAGSAGEERRGAEDAEGPTRVGDRKKAAAAENGGTGAWIEGPADETTRGGGSAKTGTTPGASGKPGKAA